MLRGTDGGKTMTVALDGDSLLPVRVSETGESGKIEALYQYKDLRFNRTVVNNDTVDGNKTEVVARNVTTLKVVSMK